MFDFNDDLKRYQIESQEQWKEWDRKMPKLHFKSEWAVKIIPPFGGAMVRFTIDYNGKHVSVYFDAFDRLGWVSKPYWEVYDFNEGPYRFLENEVDEMMEYIEKCLEN